MTETFNKEDKTMNKKQMIDELHKRLDAPFKEFMTAANRYHEQPSIPNGSRKQDARESLDKALREMAEYALENWKLSPEEFNAIVDEVAVFDLTSAYN